jgi:hypothetical protein
MNGPPRLTVLGTGYLGSTHSACMAGLAFDVLGVDTDAEKVDQLNAGCLPIYEPDLSQVHGCVATLAPLLDRPCLVVGKSTVPGWNYRALGVALTPPPSTPFCREAKRQGRGAVCFSLRPNAQGGTGKRHLSPCPSAGTGQSGLRWLLS